MSARASSEVSALVAEIELIGEEMQLLAMNAAINAAHARQQGAGLEIIAQNIHAVAEEATRHAQALARECETITGHARHLQDHERGTQASAENVGNLLEEARQRMSTIECNASRLMAMTAEVDQDAAEPCRRGWPGGQSERVQADFQDKLAPVLKRLGQLGLASEPDAATAGSANLEVLFKGLEHCYTMDSERRVHQKFINEKVTVDDRRVAGKRCMVRAAPPRPG